MGKKTKAPPKGATLLEGEELSKPLESALAASFLRFDLVEPRLHEIFVRHAGVDAPSAADGRAL